jgi:hypothetical protein
MLNDKMRPWPHRVIVKRPADPGKTMLGAQLDFRWGDQPSRLHVIGCW